MAITADPVQAALEQANEWWIEKMNELATKFATIETAWEEMNSKFDAIEIAHGASETRFVQVETAVNDWKTYMESTTARTLDKFNEIDALNVGMRNSIQVMETNVLQLRQDLQAASSGMGSNTGPGDGRKMDQLVSPQNFAPDVLNDKTCMTFWKWRKDMLIYLNIFHPGVDAIMKAVTHSKVPIDVHECRRICEANNIIVSWNYEKANRDIGLFMNKKLEGQPAALAAKAKDNGFEIMRLLSQRFDPLGVQTKAKMLDRITGPIRSPGPAKSFKETQDRVALMDRHVSDYEERLDHPQWMK